MYKNIIGSIIILLFLFVSCTSKNAGDEKPDIYYDPQFKQDSTELVYNIVSKIKLS